MNTNTAITDIQTIARLTLIIILTGTKEQLVNILVSSIQFIKIQAHRHPDGQQGSQYQGGAHRYLGEHQRSDHRHLDGPQGEAYYRSDIHQGGIHRYLEQQRSDHQHPNGYQRGAHQRPDELPKVSGKPQRSQDTLSSVNISYRNKQIEEVLPNIPSRSVSVLRGQTIGTFCRRHSL